MLVPYLFVVFFLLLGLSLFSSYNFYRKSSGIPIGGQISFFFTVGLLLYAILCIPYFDVPTYLNFSSFVLSSFLNAYSFLILSFTGVVLIFYRDYALRFDLNAYELPLFILIVAFSTIFLATASDFLVLYLSLELQALALYVIAASKVNSTFATEAGLKYFVMGSFASCLLLFGISLFYGLTGVLNFSEVNTLLALDASAETNFNGILLSLVFITVGLLFKVGAAPFHFWVPDVYTGVPVVITMFFSLIPKIGAWVVLFRLANSCFLSYTTFFSSLFVCVALLSLLVGVFGGVYQTSIKRLLAFSAVSHTGYLLLGLSTFHFEGFISNLFYLFIYALSLSPIFLILGSYSSRFGVSPVDSFYNLKSIYKFSPVLSLIFVSSLFSLAGIPPFSGFFAKLYIFYTLVDSGFVGISIIALFLSSASAVYYLKLVRFALFFKDGVTRLFLFEVSRSVAYLIVVFFFLNILFFIWGADLLLLLNYFYSKTLY
jgi:NADH-quinone oxidoreductase subunit N